MADQTQTDKPWESPGRWRVSPYNFLPEVTAEYDYTEPVRFIESTIRMLELTPGTRVPFPVEQKVEIATLLDRLGAPIVSCNPTHFFGTARNKSITDGVRAIAKRAFRFKLQGALLGVWKESETVLEERADWYAEMGIRIMTITMPSSAEQARRGYGAGSQLGRSDLPYQEIVDRALHLMEYAKRIGLESGANFAGSSGVAVEQLVPVINQFIRHGADIFGLVDNGYFSPQATKHYLKKLKNGLAKRVPFLYHAHDEFGLGTANAIVATLEGGIADIAVNGIGESAFADTSQVILSLELLHGVRTGFDLSMLTEVSRTVERITGMPMQPLRPITGMATYVPSEIMPGGFIDLLRGEPMGLHVIAPELVGAKARAVWQEQVVKPEVVKTKLALMKLPHSDQDVSRALNAIAAALNEKENWPAWLEDFEVEELCHRALGAAGGAD